MAGSDSARKPQKTLKAVPDKVFPSMLRLVFEEGGKVPEHLDGLYKSMAKAKKAIEYYNEGYDRKKIYPRAPREEKPSSGFKKEYSESPRKEEDIINELTTMQAELDEALSITEPVLPPPPAPERSVETDGEESDDS